MELGSSCRLASGPMCGPERCRGVGVSRLEGHGEASPHGASTLLREGFGRRRYLPLVLEEQILRFKGRVFRA